jgi:predicted DsbA family dithiol-disulfide isomerase
MAKKGLKHKLHKIKPKKVSKHKGKIIAITAFVVLLFLFIWYRSGDIQPDTEGMVKVDFYVMSQCPYGTQVEDAIKPVLDVMGDNIDFNLEFIATETSPGKFSALHGQPEVEGNIAQLCAIKHASEDYKYMEMIVCMNENARAIPGNWESCAEKNGLDVTKIKECYEGDEGKQLLSESAKKAQAVNARGSPTIFINDQPYNGNRDSLSFQKVICANLEDHPECEGLPKCSSDVDCIAQPGKIGLCKNPGEENAECEYQDPVEVDMIVLNDKDCKSCDTTQIMDVTKKIFPGVVPREVDVSTLEGQQLVEELDIQFLPAFVFDNKVTETYVWKNDPRITTAFESKGDKFKLSDAATGSTHFASEEARQAYYDAIGVTPGDNRPQIDFFVMSYCPYGNQAEEAIEPAYQLLKNSADFNPRYVVYTNYNGGGPQFCIADGKYCSMHGIQELNQNIREACVGKHIGMDEWFEFAMAMNDKCNYKNADTCWEAVAEDLGLDTAMIKECEANEGEQIAKEDFELNQILKVSGSPTVFIDGEMYKGQRAPEGFKAALCAAFDSPPEACNEILASTEGPAPQGQC